MLLLLLLLLLLWPFPFPPPLFPPPLPLPPDEPSEFGECGPLDGDFFQGWNPLPTAASASGGGDLLDNLLH